MRILQLIDTLNPGGAERMAVNYANSTIDYGHDSFLISTREKGHFLELLNKDVKYFFLNRQSIFNIQAILIFKEYLHRHNIDIVHAHGTSWFFAVLCKLVGGNFKLIWHNHYGASREMSLYRTRVLVFFSRFFNGIISVNQELKEWADIHLKCRNSISLVNFVSLGKQKIIKEKRVLNVVCLANLRPVKNHILLLNACDLVREDESMNLHLIGKDFNDDYSTELKKEFKERSYVKFHGEKVDPNPILERMEIGVLSSNSEGMPMAILEYGAAGLSIVSTDVGACKRILNGHANIVAPGDINGLANAIKTYLNDPKKAQKDSKAFHDLVLQSYSAKSVIPKYLDFCKSL